MSVSHKKEGPERKEVNVGFGLLILVNFERDSPYFYASRSPL
jgi:hypothetical protein